MILELCDKSEKIIEIIYVYIKLLYYKFKYGKRLRLGRKIRFRKGFRLYMDKNAKVEIGNNVFFNKNCTVDAFFGVTIKDNNLFGENVKIYDHNHIFYDKNLERRSNFTGERIIVGNNNWFGTNSMVLSGSTIGNNNVIGAGIIVKPKMNLENDNIIKLKSEIYKNEKIIYKV